MSTNSDQKPQNRPVPLRLLMACLLFLGISAIGGGGQFLLNPTGDIIGMPVDVLAGSPFTDFLLPGMILFTALGLFPLVVLYGLYTERRWAWPAAIMVGIALIVWIVVQGLIVGFGHWLQWLYLSLGFVLILLALLPSVRQTV
ncbi:hypothetical protein [Natronococcus pandeyae]|nr:hypothetical protein [Natronococcus pandeyae]